MARGRVRGIGRVRRLLRRLPIDVRHEIVVELGVTGRQMLNAVLARTPRRTGALARGLKQKVLPASLRLQIGLIGTPRERTALFYGRIQDLGRKAQVVRVFRRHGTFAPTYNRNGTRKKTPETTYLLRVRGMAPKRFITGRYPEVRSVLRENVKGIFVRALQRSGGGSE